MCGRRQLRASCDGLSGEEWGEGKAGVGDRDESDGVDDDTMVVVTEDEDEDDDDDVQADMLLLLI